MDVRTGGGKPRLKLEILAEGASGNNAVPVYVTNAQEIGGDKEGFLDALEVVFARPVRKMGFICMWQILFMSLPRINSILLTRKLIKRDHYWRAF
jgi:hypothetical protein